MNRTEFTEKITRFMCEIFDSGERIILCEAFRPEIAQVFYFLTGKSKLDGINKKSNHQFGKAVDFHFIGLDGQLIIKGHPEWKDASLYIKWHKIWQEKYGGKPMISWDTPHWEVE